MRRYNSPDDMKNRNGSPHPYALITILCWAPTYVMSHMLAPYFSPAALGSMRYTIAGLILAAILAARRTPLPERKDIPWFALSAVCGFSLYMIVFNIGTSLTSSATSSVIIASTPVFTGILASILFRERLNVLQWGAMAVQFAGVIILVLEGGSLNLNHGVFWLLLSALLLGTYNIMQRRFTKKYPPFLTSAFTVILGGLELIWALPEGIRDFGTAPAKMRLFVIILGVFSSAVAYVTWTIAFSKAEKTSEVSNYMFITPFFAALLGFLLNNEVPGSATLAGGLMILSGAVLFNRAGRKG